MTWGTDIPERVRTAWGYRDEPEYMRVLANTYWHACLFIAALLVAGFSFYSGFTFFAALGPAADDAPLVSGGGGVLFNRGELEAVLGEFDARALRYEAIQGERSSIADPSR